MTYKLALAVVSIFCVFYVYVSITSMFVPKGYTKVSSFNFVTPFRDQIIEIESNGHLYIVYRGYHAVSMIHDPSCPCEGEESE